MNLSYYFYYIEFRIVLGGSEWVGLTTNEERRQKLVLMHQVSLCVFQRELNLGWNKKSGGRNIEETLWGYKNR